MANVNAAVTNAKAPADAVGTGSPGSKSVEAWDLAEKQAKDAGISWRRPEDDKRSAKDIIDGDALLKNLGNQSGVKDMLKEQVGGDFETDADAAFRAAQVLDHVERFDEGGNRIAGSDVGNSRIDGFTKGGDAKHGTEAGRLQDFGKYGFSNLQGKLQNPGSVGDDAELRKTAEDAGVMWELPDGDKRSAQDVIGDNPLLKNLGDQSGVKQMLKEKVGDFETDADAAFRAAQVLDRVTMYDAKGKPQSGGDVSNSSIDGFTKSGEAKPDTEAGRLQDFGKYGFGSLPGVEKTEDIAAYKDFLKANPDADDASKKFAGYAAVLAENFDSIKGKTGAGDNPTAADLKSYMDKNPQISGDLREALNFWWQPGAFKTIETAQNPLKFAPDGELSKDDVTNWINSAAPKDATSAMTFLAGAVDGDTVADVDVSKLNKDIFEHPENHSTKEKAAALQDLLAAQTLIGKGAEAGMWGDDYSKVSIANRSSSHPDPKEVLKDVNAHIGKLESDPEVVKFLGESRSKQMATLLGDNPGLRGALQKTYDADIKSGGALDSLWDAKTKDGKTDQQAALAEFYGSAKLFQDALGVGKPGEIQDAVKASRHGGEFEQFYEKSLATGDRFNALLKDHSFEEAAAAYTGEVALYNGALDPQFTGKFDTQLNDSFTRISRENAFKDASFKDLETAFGVNGGDELDEAKVKSLIEQVGKSNPELFVNKDGAQATPDQILSGFRGSWDVLRQGTKSLAELAPTLLNPAAKDAADRGILHGASGLLMAGVTIARGVQSGGNPTDRQIVDITTGSIQSATLLTEGNLKNFQQFIKDAGLGKDLTSKLTDLPKRFENGAKGLGGLAGIVAGAYGVFDGVQSIRKGDKISGGISITSGSLGVIAGVASAIEGGVGAFGSAAVRPALAPVAAFAGVAGLATAGVASLAMLLPGLIKEGQQQAAADSFGDLLGGYLEKYEIDGVPNGDVDDLPASVWPEDNSVAS